MEDFLMKLHNDQYLKIDAAGKTPDELCASAQWLVQKNASVPLKPAPKVCQDMGDLLNDPIPLPNGDDPPEGTLPRTYSLWAQTDPVALRPTGEPKKPKEGEAEEPETGKVIPGLPELAACYANNMFTFATEENMQAFVKEPRKYLETPPRMPKCYRLMMMGPKGIGIHTQAERLNLKYGWKIIDYPQLVRDRLAMILKRDKDAHVPNNVEPEESEIGLSKEEEEIIRTGKPFPSWKFVPWVLDELGLAL
jgi:hypothetical protein